MKRWICALLVLCMLPLTALADRQVTANWYEVFVRSYQDSDGDGLGDLKGLISRLDYIEDMGYNGLWLMPVMPSPSYHKYDVTDYLDIDPEYGTLADMRSLIQACHERSIRVIVDLPVNHTSTQHPWFQAAAAAIRSGNTADPSISFYHFTQSPGDRMVPLSDTGWYYEEAFAGGAMPDLNLDNKAVREELRAILRFWLADMGVDGFRLDAVTSYYTAHADQNIAFLAWLKETCESISPGCYLVGECWAGLETIAQYYASGVDSFFLFPASQAEGFIAASLRGRGAHAEKFAKSYQRVLDAIGDGLLAPFLSNHDTGRTIGAVQGRSNLPAAKFAEAVMNMLGGCAFTYYGEEIGMVGSGEDPNKRLAMYWSDGDMTQQPPGVTTIEYAYPSVEAQQADPNSLLNYCRELNQLKLAYPLLAEGKTEIVTASGDLLVLRRYDADSSLLIAMNFSAKDEVSMTLKPTESVSAALLTGSEPLRLEAGDGAALLTLPPYALALLRQQLDRP